MSTPKKRWWKTDGSRPRWRHMQSKSSRSTDTNLGTDIRTMTFSSESVWTTTLRKRKSVQYWHQLYIRLQTGSEASCRWASRCCHQDFWQLRFHCRRTTNVRFQHSDWVETIFGFHNESAIKSIETVSSETAVSHLHWCSKRLFLCQDEWSGTDVRLKCSKKWPNICGGLTEVKVTTGQNMLQKLQNIQELRCLRTLLCGNLERIDGRPDNCGSGCDSEEKNSKK